MKKAIINVLFFTLGLMCSIGFAQSEEISEPTNVKEAILIEKFRKVPNGFIKMLLDNVFIELQNDPTATTYFLNFGPVREVLRVEKIVRSQIVFRQYDASRIIFVNGGKGNKLQTQIWKVPAGAEPPAIEYIEEKKNSEQ